MADHTFDPATTVLQDIAGEYTLDPTHSRLGFSTRHAMVTTVRGAFKEFSGDAVVDTENPAASKVTVNIKAGSIDTGVADRDGHLHSADFFDVETYPEITFVSTAFDGESLTGDLTIKDVTRSVTLDVEFNGVATDPWGNEKAAFEATADINRNDWGLTWNANLEKGGVLVSEKVKLVLDVQLAKQA